jgi:hypothetical protein
MEDGKVQMYGIERYGCRYQPVVEGAKTMKQFAFVLVFMGAICAEAAAPPPNKTNPYLSVGDASPRFSQELVFREEQETMGGRSVTTWKITPPGRLTVIRNSLDLKGKPKAGWPREVRSESLTGEQIQTLATELQSQRILSLPATLGADVEVNAHNYMLRFGEKESVLYGVPPLRRGTLKDHILNSTPEHEDRLAVERFATAAQRIIDTGASKTSPADKGHSTESQR